MEVKKYNLFVFKPKPKQLPKPKPKSKPKTELAAKGLSLEKKKLDIFYAKGFVKTSTK